MSEEIKEFQGTTLENLNNDQLYKYFEELKSKKQSELNDSEKCEYLFLTYHFEGKDKFLEDSYIVTLVQELIFSLLSDEREIPNILIDTFIISHIDWLIDWKKSNDLNKTTVRQDIVDNMHTFINPFLEEIEEILNVNYKSLDRNHINKRIVSIIDKLFYHNETDKLPLIFNALFKVKYALEAAREYLNSNFTKSITVAAIDYQLDIQSIAHIFLRHTHRFSSLSHKNNNVQRGYFDNVIGEEYYKLDFLLTNLKLDNLKTSDGAHIFKIEDHNYKIVIRSGRVITLYPLN